jgi:hypothetical protein
LKEHFPRGALKALLFVLAFGLAEAIGVNAFAASEKETYRTTCHGSDCVRFLCNEAGFQCVFLGYFDRSEELHPECVGYDQSESTSLVPRQVCDNGEKADNSPHYHYENVFDPDNDYYAPYE